MSFRKVLLLGNGINRSFSSSSWSDVIHDIAKQKNPDSLYARDENNRYDISDKELTEEFLKK